ncbi:phosphonate ABC transporter substrate-binding protein [Chelatococcus daeguensis]|uniref:Phosphonate ABC transporter substrate-binding protein n=1 Tax=Chelatococcus daeguensis TaxID=444444 RepID=A0AAC9JV45_9HYPH|nr:phosphonate ABC transporter substrate-binding protein [Chelatococcus daeguensis]APF37772.1 phosphonate ABC transporter substrate-binding protein [Chelatococcus daeguensis]
MLNRRALIGAAAASFAFAGMAQIPAFAGDWKAKYPELIFSVVPAENASGVNERYDDFVAYLSKELGVPVKLRIANDYAAVIEGQKAGNIHIAYYGPASLSRAVKVTNGGVEPFVTTINSDGTVGYYSVAYVKADSPYQSIDDLKGKNLGLVDPNSTSGNNVPRFALDKQGIDPEQFFGKVVYAGSHENAVTALEQGTVDVAFNWWNSENDSNLTRMANKGMAKKENFRIIYKSDLIQGSPYAYLTDLPADLKQAIAKAFQEAPQKNKAAFDKLSDGKDKGFAPITTEDYKATIELIEFVDRLKRKKAS